MIRSGLVAASAAILLAAGAEARDPPPEPDQTQIVVEGRRDRGSEIKDLIHSLPPVPVGGHISRFEREVCPAVLGVTPEKRALAVARMRRVGTAAGLRMGRAGCSTNVLVIVTPDKKRLIAQLAVRLPNYFGDMPRREIAALANRPGPTALWHAKSLIDADGRELYATSTQSPVARRTTRATSRITDLAHPDLAGSILVVEAGALPGLSTTQLADYAAMRTFTGADPARLPDRRISTILTVFDAPADVEVPVTLTPWDLAFLKALYASNPNHYAAAQRGQIRARMEDELGGGKAGGGSR